MPESPGVFRYAYCMFDGRFERLARSATRRPLKPGHGSKPATRAHVIQTAIYPLPSPSPLRVNEFVNGRDLFKNGGRGAGGKIRDPIQNGISERSTGQVWSDAI